jgi:3-deoxy-manno-octulosonate cytidylyltransferase (CMP-KDO synthetase)
VPPVSDTGPAVFQGSLSAIAIIPARYHSTRLPGKALADIGGRPMIEHVYRRAAAARSIARVIVATDDERIAEVVRGFGGEAVLTSTAHQSGTDRLAEAAASLTCDLIVNVQETSPSRTSDDRCGRQPFDRRVADMSTLRRRIDDAVDTRIRT